MSWNKYYITKVSIPANGILLLRAVFGSVFVAAGVVWVSIPANGILLLREWKGLF